MKCAFVTGGGAGIGKSVALRLGSAGYSVGLLDIDGDAAEATAAEIGDTALAFAGDVRDESLMAASIGATVERFGPLDAAVACAGVEVYGKVADMEIAAWERALSINLTGVMLTARYAVREFLKNGGGSFVAISSDAGVRAAIDWTPYTVSKHGVIGLVRAIAVDYGPQGIRSNAVCPSFTETPMADRVLAQAKEDRETWTEPVPLKRFGQPEEVANAVAHLVSDEASYTTGSVYMIDGGLTVGF